MQALFGHMFLAEILNPHPFAQQDTVKLCFDHKQFPEFIPYLKKHFLQKIPVLYQDDLQECMLRVTRCSLRSGSLSESVPDEKIQLKTEDYGECVETLPVEKRREYLHSHTSGRIEVLRVDVQ